jgi:hypothetical protein
VMRATRAHTESEPSRNCSQAIARLRGKSGLSDNRARPRSQRAPESTRDHGHWKLKSVDECAAPSAGILLSLAG